MRRDSPAARRILPRLAVGVALLGVPATGCGADGSTTSAPSGAGTTSADASAAPDRVRPLTSGDALRVVAGPGGARVLRTQDGRDVLLRGANVNALVDYAGARKVVPVQPADGLQMRALGFSVVRLAVSWSAIEPRPGTFDGGYLDRIRSTARVFADQGIYVLLDLHQDRYAAGLSPAGDESDGAPPWAVRSRGGSTAAGTSGGHPYYTTAASRAAATAFFDDRRVAGKPLQDHYADALARLAAVGRDLGPALAGVELYNEPIDPGSTAVGGPDRFSPGKLWPFYTRLIRRLRGPDGLGPGAGPYDGPIWFQPVATRTQTDRDAAAARFSDDRGLVYGPHVYTDVFSGTNDAGTPDRIASSLRAAAGEARAYGAALAPDELPGASGGQFEDDRRATLDQLDALGIGGMVWVWKQDPAFSYGWGVLNADGSRRDDSAIADDYGRARVQASAPEVRSARWSAGVLTVRTSGAGDVDLWDGAAFAATAPGDGASSRLTVDGAPPATGTVTSWPASAALGASAWAGGRQLRVRVPAGRHVLVLGP